MSEPRLTSVSVTKTSRRLADGREIIYFDRAPGVQRLASDTRDLGHAEPHSELRYDTLTGTWVMFASHRQDRTYMPAAEDCPLCPSRPGHPTEVPEPDYEVVVFQNRFPALASAPGAGHGHVLGARGASEQTAHDQTGHDQTADERAQPQPWVPEAPGTVLPWRSGAGRCEVVCYTPDHDASFADLDGGAVDVVLSALVDRTTELGAQEGVEEVFCFENRGAEIGVTQPHPHGQIYAYPFVTLRTERMLQMAALYRHQTERNLYDDVVAEERAERSRLVLSTSQWTAFVPHAARWPYEIHCYPNRRAPDLAALAPEARLELPDVLHDIFSRFARLFDEPAPYIAGWHQAPVRQGRADFAVHLEMFTLRRTNDKLKYLAGSESGMYAFANDVMPEDAARRLRDLAP